MKISPLTGAETLKQICLFVRSANSIRESKEECRRYQGEICFISPLKTIKRKVKRQRADQLVENVAHAPEQIATTKRVSTTKSLRFTDKSGNISVSSTPTRSTGLKAKRNQSAN